MAARGPQKWPTGSEKVIERYDQLSLNKFFDPSTHSMRKGDNGEETRLRSKVISLNLFLFSIFPWVLGLAPKIFFPHFFLQKIPSKVVQQSW